MCITGYVEGVFRNMCIDMELSRGESAQVRERASEKAVSSGVFAGGTGWESHPTQALKDDSRPEQDCVARFEAAAGEVGDAAAEDVAGFEGVAGAAVELPFDPHEDAEVLERDLIVGSARPLDGVGVAAVFGRGVEPVLE